MSQKLIFVVDDEDSIRRLLEHMISGWGYKVRGFSDGEACLEHLDATPDLIVLDIMMPRLNGVESLKRIKQQDPELPVLMISAQGQIETAIETIKMGAVDYFSKPVDFSKLQIAIQNALKTHELSREVRRLRETITRTVHFDNIISNDRTMQEVFRLIQKVKDNDISVLIQGESGTGKELIARAIHFNGNRNEKPFVVVNCASIPRDLLESELFGHEKGAFTGAIQRKIGKFELAHTGTLFLDEIGELDMSLQAKLLRAIQTKQFERVGGNETVTSDLRIITATNRILKQSIFNKEFREDLYYRLATFPIHLPALRERRSDILLLAEHFLKKFNENYEKNEITFSRKAIQMLYDYPWPGNIRELENAIERAVLLTDGSQITEKELPLGVQSFDTGETGSIFSSSVLPEQDIILPFEKIKEQAIRHAMKLTEGNMVETARKLQIARSTLYELLKKYNIQSAIA